MVDEPQVVGRASEVVDVYQGHRVLFVDYLALVPHRDILPREYLGRAHPVPEIRAVCAEPVAEDDTVGLEGRDGVRVAHGSIIPEGVGWGQLSYK